ncbi:MAG: family 10 glycosylhydrolase, partial [Oscillospiraceae bacterium]|nr:family 10 glycosylhydrolase [Oscillospiraceae bacterium]
MNRNARRQHPRLRGALTAVLAAALLTGGLPQPALSEETEFRAVWVASVINLDYPSQTGLSVAALKREADSLLNNAQDMGFNAVILQVRPTGDALYASSVFPWSEVLTGEQGKAPGFDPLAYFVEEAHLRGMELHAWVNPFRVARNTAGTDGLSDNNPAKLNPLWTVAHSDGHLYYNPGIPEVRELIISGVRELVTNYDIDGLHYDDYFYPGKDFHDSAAFAAYGGAFTDIADWRRENVNAVVRETQAVARAEGVRFGVAPQAIWANKVNNPLGSDTAGYETYYEQFADTRKWVLEGWVDYIAPQIYWEIGRDGSDYSKVLAWWADLVTGTETDLYIGHATYLMNGGSSRAAWTDTGEIARQIAENKLYPAVKGDIHFRYGLIAGDRAIAAAIKDLYGGAQPVSAAGGIVMPPPAHGTLNIGRPARDVTYKGENYYFVGASDPAQPLTVNGTEITNRTPLGYFSHYAGLTAGENVFTFKQGESAVTRIVTVPTGSSSSAPEAMAEPVIAQGVFPETYDEIHPPGTKVTLSCVAPIGAALTVRVGGQTLAMKPAVDKKPEGGGYFATRYTAEYVYPDFTASGDVPVITVGTPLYTMILDGVTTSRAATASLKLSTKAERFVAEVAGNAFVYPGAATSGGPVGELSAGQIDTVVSVQNAAWVKLGCGLWIQRADVRFRIADRKLQSRVSAASYHAGEKWDTLTVQTDIRTA